MGTTSYIFFGLLLIPLIIFLIWAIKQDKKKNYLGLFFLIVGVIIAIYTILRLDKDFMENNTQVAPKASSFK
ncbi:hypothetical protein GM921_00095 [Pedobacter sp. LMG 31464]|uniref:Uncharacterized protein n=1 Tax=Pedobacter planticolens TaxID=2679964 RepID=A0A923DU39_9SPHI|nr:hypothetical protein [Pedobacter planticolens]MBB2143869.1 hypothetical protein [Pedobacter planticolens]